MEPTYTVTYFPFKALGESIRYLLSYGGVEFEDQRIPMEDWPKLKDEMPFKQMPILEVNGKRAHQSIAIARYLAREFKLTRKDAWEDLEIDSIVYTVNDLRSKIATYYYETNEAAKARRKDILDKDTIPYYLDRLETIAKANNGHLALGRLTWADFYFASLAGWFHFYNRSDMFAGKENLQLVIGNVENIPAIKIWIEKRPKTDF